MNRQITGSLAEKQTQQRVIEIPALDMQGTIQRVAVYIRVSTGSKEQMNSFSAQSRHYLELVAEKPDWKLVDIYADEGISGTRMDRRDDFLRMLEDCRKGKIDRILVKSVSRFARNTKDLLETTRELGLLGVSVFFEEQNLDTSQLSSESLLAIFASTAQQESVSISENMRWSYERRMQSGEFVTTFAPFGYTLQKKQLTICEPEAQIVRWIFQQYLNGWRTCDIARELRSCERPDGARDQKWQTSTIYYILNNERYIGDALLRKKTTTEQFPFRKIRNRGEKRQYYASNNHPAIISREVFEKAQQLMKSRAPTCLEEIPDKTFRRKIICGCCGASFKRRQSNGREYWLCSRHFENKDACRTMPVSEKSLEDAFLRMYDKLRNEGFRILEQMLSRLTELRERQLLWSPDIVALNQRISDYRSQDQLLTSLKQQGMVDPEVYLTQSDRLAEQLRTAKKEKERLLRMEEDASAAKTQMLLDLLRSGPQEVYSFDAELFGELVDQVIAEQGQVRFRLINGLELTEPLEKGGRR